MNDMIDISGLSYQEIAAKYNDYVQSHIVRMIFEDEFAHLLSGIDDDYVLEQNCAAIEAICNNYFSDEALAIYNDQLFDDECYDSVGDVRRAITAQSLKLKERVNEIQKRKGFRNWLMLRQR